MTLRSGLADALAEALPGYVVVGSSRPLDGINKPTLVLFTSDLEPLATAPNGHYRLTYTLTLLTPVQDANADDALDGMLIDVLAVLWNAPDVVVTQGSRTVYADKFQAWDLTLTTVFKISNDDEESE